MISRRLWESALELQSFLEIEVLDFSFIGGLAVQRWGQPRTCSAEDLIVMKCFADRPLDWIDVRGFVEPKRLPLARQVNDQDGRTGSQRHGANLPADGTGLRSDGRISATGPLNLASPTACTKPSPKRDKSLR